MTQAERILKTQSKIQHRMKIMKSIEPRDWHFNPAEVYARAVKHGWGDPDAEVRRHRKMHQEYLESCRHNARNHLPIGLCSCCHCRAERYFKKLQRRKSRHEAKQALKELQHSEEFLLFDLPFSEDFDD